MNNAVSADIEAIHRLRAKAFENGDIWDLIDYFTDDAVWMPNGGRAVEGKDAIRAWATRFDGRTYKLRIIPEEVVVSGEWAFDRFVGVMTPISATGADEGASNYFQYFWTLRRQGDDSWKVAHWIWNEHTPV